MDTRTIWLVLSVLRVAWVLLPQSGYIHPDEFFQSPEVMAGKVLNYKVRETWEWDEDFPIRSPVLPFLASGIPFLVLKTINYLGLLSELSAYSLLIAPRLWTTILSFFIDFCLWKVCNTCTGSKGQRLGAGMDKFKCLAVFSASYVTLVFFTRTFSNTLEAVLFAAVLALVFDSFKDEEPQTSERENRVKGAKSENFVSDRVGERHSSNSHSVLLSVLIVVGCFNRPAFPAFALVPTLYWAFHPSKGWNLKEGILKALQLLPGAIVTTAIFVVCDSMYFGSFDVHSLTMDTFLQSPSSLFQNLTVTPWNFLRYNIDTSKVKEHGLHPRITHLVVNTPLLFGVLAILAFLDAFGFVTKLFSSFKEGNNKTTAQNSKRKATSTKSHSFIKDHATIDEDAKMLARIRRVKEVDLEIFFLLSYFIPIFILSAVAHQEPRFISPCIIPLVLAHHRKITWTRGKLNKLLSVGFVIGNVFCGILFGVLHQGGVVPSLLHLHKLVRQQNSTQNVHIVYFHTYMPPTYLLGIHGNQTTNQNVGHVLEEATNGNVGPDVHLHDLAGAPTEVLFSELTTLYQDELVKNHTHIYVVSPHSLHEEIRNHESNIDLVLREVFFPHLSMEDPPNVLDIVHVQTGKNTSLLERLRCTFGLNLYEFIPPFN
ncbi:GPI mannosyltransferase 4-like [Branchiostoma lanceolatum]|uniref:GPI mannosyltransferase 4-like n=1 Tax=Branchiostoma lanceolatum TaxID=7740 RepID=UPI00345579C4